MKELFEKMVKIIEDAKGAQEVVEKELQKYYDTNKQLLEDAQKKISTKMEEVMKTITDPSNIQDVMQKMFGALKDFMGDDLFNKFIELQNKYPFVQDVMKKIMPMKK